MHMKIDLSEAHDDDDGGDAVVYNKRLMIILVSLLILILTVILVGNATVIKHLLSKKRTSRMHFYLLMLATADTLVGIILVIPDILEKCKVTYHFGDIFCKIQYVISIAVSCNAAYVLVCVSIDRLVAITRPMFIEHNCLRYSLLGSSWALSFINGVPMILFRHIIPVRIKTEEYNATKIETIMICAVEATRVQSQILVVFYTTMIFFLPLSVMIVCHGIIINALRTKNKTIEHRPNRFLRRREGSVGRERLQSIHVYSARTMELLAKAKLKSVKMTLVIISAYVACWSPYFIFNILSTFNLVHRGGIVIFMHSLGYLNSACNPMIFWMFTNGRRSRSSETCNKHELGSHTGLT
ncbi:hypothetical protein ACOME3_007411 [Neoechinorhynchus agilis]